MSIVYLTQCGSFHARHGHGGRGPGLRGRPGQGGGRRDRRFFGMEADAGQGQGQGQGTGEEA